MQPPMRYTGEKPVDPLIVNVWPLKPGTSSSYSVYEDSGVVGRVPARRLRAYADQGHAGRRHAAAWRSAPSKAAIPGMLKTRGYELRLPADWPPASVTVNGAPVKQAGPTGEGGWSFEGNTLTTVIPVPARAASTRR